MLSLIVAYIRTMAPKAQKSPKDQKKGKKKAKQPLLGRIVFLFMGLFLAMCVILYYCMLLCTMDILLVYLSSKMKYFCSYKVRQTLNGA